MIPKNGFMGTEDATGKKFGNAASGDLQHY
jgi:hypothetical protein